MISVRKIVYHDYGRIYYKDEHGKWERNRTLYKNVLQDLFLHYGNRCMFCNRLLERKANDELQYSIEHLKEKSEYEELANCVHNFALACRSCNEHRDISHIGETPISHENIFSTYIIEDNGKIVTRDISVYCTIISYGLNSRKKIKDERAQMVKYYKLFPFLLDLDINKIMNNDSVDYPALTLKYSESLDNRVEEIDILIDEFYERGL